mmetsp:Transcript_82829/g.177541  ORF Transcript_82829/g.177541 Transcript_82829/m.177541 type:complete len:288 (+) Transcript_82829:708-1571(+)
MGLGLVKRAVDKVGEVIRLVDDLLQGLLLQLDLPTPLLLLCPPLSRLRLGLRDGDLLLQREEVIEDNRLEDPHDLVKDLCRQLEVVNSLGERRYLGTAQLAILVAIVGLKVATPPLLLLQNRGLARGLLHGGRSPNGQALHRPSAACHLPAEILHVPLRLPSSVGVAHFILLIVEQCRGRFQRLTHILNLLRRLLGTLHHGLRRHIRSLIQGRLRHLLGLCDLPLRTLGLLAHFLEDLRNFQLLFLSLFLLFQPSSFLLLALLFNLVDALLRLLKRLDDLPRHRLGL